MHLFSCYFVIVIITNIKHIQFLERTQSSCVKKDALRSRATNGYNQTPMSNKWQPLGWWEGGNGSTNGPMIILPTDPRLVHVTGINYARFATSPPVRPAAPDPDYTCVLSTINPADQSLRPKLFPRDKFGFCAPLKASLTRKCVFLSHLYAETCCQHQVCTDQF
ncbi:hypothetical protein J6590_018094 [Homalodisca vitripennis]|nr:hypothetical protein J6590_018094 [Homalodisca vitripennis]